MRPLPFFCANLILGFKHSGTKLRLRLFIFLEAGVTAPTGQNTNHNDRHMGFRIVFESARRIKRSEEGKICGVY